MALERPAVSRGPSDVGGDLSVLVQAHGVSWASEPHQVGVGWIQSPEVSLGTQERRGPGTVGVEEEQWAGSPL